MGCKYALNQSIKPTLAPLAVAISVALTAGSLQAATITVNTLNDGLIDDYCSLRSALYTATNNAPYQDCALDGAGDDVIVFAPALNGTIQLQAGAALNGYGADDSSLPVGESVVIDGDNRITVSGTGNGRVFDVIYDTTLGLYAEEVTFSNITISNGGGEDVGGGIRSQALELNLDNVTLSDNNADLAGGALFHNPDGPLPCLVPISGLQPGAELQEGAPECPPSLSVLSSIFDNNTTSMSKYDGGGGAIYTVLEENEALLISDSSFIDNDANGGNGGAVNLQQSFSRMTVEDSIFTDNAALNVDGSGGAVYANLDFARVTISGNQFHGNTAVSNGGALSLLEDLAKEQQAAIYLHNNTVNANQAGERGGGFYISVFEGSSGSIESPAKFVELNGNTITNNTAEDAGGGLHLVVDDVVTSTISGLILNDNASIAGFGGGAFLSATRTQVTIADTQVNSNNAGAGGGGIQLVANDVSLLLNASRLISNNAFSGCGGGLRISGDPSTVDISSSVFQGNYSSDCGGGISIANPGLGITGFNLNNSELSTNTSAGLQSGPGASRGGGALFVSLGEGSQSLISNSTVSGNTLTGQYGGGIHFGGEMVSDIRYSTIANNYADSDGGGIFNESNNCAMNNSLMSGNSIAGAAAQDLDGINCTVSNSLLAGADNSNFGDNGNNILNTDPLLGPLTNNGGQSQTHALLPGSPAIDAGSAGEFTPDLDQRGEGFPRIVGTEIDMGAFEFLVDELFSDRFEQTVIVPPPQHP